MRGSLSCTNGRRSRGLRGLARRRDLDALNIVLRPIVRGLRPDSVVLPSRLAGMIPVKVSRSRFFRLLEISKRAEKLVARVGIVVSEDIDKHRRALLDTCCNLTLIIQNSIKP